jgi:hypothetical protein
MTQPDINEFEVIESSPLEEGFRVDDDQKADWALRKLAVIRRKQAENQSIFDAELARIKEWLSKVNTALERDSAYFEAVLTPYALQQRSEGRKTVTLPHGTLKTTAGQSHIEFKDESKFIEWAKVNDPALLRIKTDVDKSALKVLISEEGVLISTQGEIIPDVEVIPGQTSVKFITE